MHLKHHNNKSSHSRQCLFGVRKTQAPRPESPISLCWTLDATQQSSARRRDRPPRRCSLGVTRRRDQVIAAGPALIHGSAVTVRDLPGRAHLGVCNFGIKGKRDVRSMIGKSCSIPSAVSWGSRSSHEAATGSWVFGGHSRPSSGGEWYVLLRVRARAACACELECGSSLSDAFRAQNRSKERAPRACMSKHPCPCF